MSKQVPSQVWCPILNVGDVASLWTCQRLSDLMPSSASDAEKLQAASQVANDLVKRLAADESKGEQKPKMTLDCTTAAHTCLYCLANNAAVSEAQIFGANSTATIDITRAFKGSNACGGTVWLLPG